MACVLFFHQTTKAQCINTFPYSQDFEKFTNHSSTVSCTTTEAGDTADGWTQEQTDFGEWRSDSAGTPSYMTGPGATFTSSGSGIGKDYNPGTTGGTYMYLESSGGAACADQDISLLSPCFDFSGTNKYILTFAYHMHGGAVSSLHVDVLDSTVWDNDVWVKKGHQSGDWLIARIPLDKYNTSHVQIRIRGKIGSTWSSDIAIDDFRIKAHTGFTDNIELFEVVDTTRKYYHTTTSHTDSVGYDFKIRNLGANKANSITLTGKSGNWTHSQSIGSLEAYSDTVFSMSRKFLPKSSGQENITFSLSMSATDQDTNDNKLLVQTGLNDSVVGRDNGIYVNSLGFNGGTGFLGQMMDVLENDTLTGVRVFFMNPVPGDSVQVHLYENNSGLPGTLIASSSHIVFTTGGWYQAKFDCDRPLSTGSYFIAVQQIFQNHMNLGYATHAYELNTTVVSNTGAPSSWNALTGFPNPLAIRMVFGNIHRPEAKITSMDSVCQKQRLTINASGGDTYLWAPAANIKFPKNRSTIAESDTSFTLKLKTWDACGIPSKTTSKFIKINATPKGSVSPDTTICLGDDVTITAQGGTSYRWVNGPSNSSWKLTPTKGETYQVVFDSSNGCKLTLGTTVSVERVVAHASGDTAICSGTTVQLSATGGDSYFWIPTGVKGNPVTVSPLTNTQYIVEAKSTRGCTDTDTVEVTVHKAPDLTMPHDTIVCFGQRFEFVASGADSFQWLDGPSTANYSILPILGKWFYCDGINKNGCTKRDSVYMAVAPVPQVELRDDTTICEGTNIDLEALTSNKVEFIWSTGDTSRTITVGPKEQTTYKVLVKNNGNCADSTEVTIDVDPLPVFVFTTKLEEGKFSVINHSEHTDSHHWTFGDGDESTDKSPFHKYQDTGTYQVTYTATNECGPVDTTFTIVHDWVSVHDIKNLLGLKIYPQPASETVSIKVEDPNIIQLELSLYDMAGKLVLHEKSAIRDGQVDLKIHELSAGSYTLIAKASNGSSRHILIKQ